MMKGTLHQQDIILLSIYIPQSGSTEIYKATTNRTRGRDGQKHNCSKVPKYQMAAMERSSKQKINKETLSFNDTLDLMHIIDIHRALHLRTPDYTFLSSTRGTFSKIDHMLGLKTTLANLRRLKSVVWPRWGHRQITLYFLTLPKER